MSRVRRISNDDDDDERNRRRGWALSASIPSLLLTREASADIDRAVDLNPRSAHLPASNLACVD